MQAVAAYNSGRSHPQARGQFANLPFRHDKGCYRSIYERVGSPHRRTVGGLPRHLAASRKGRLLCRRRVLLGQDLQSPHPPRLCPPRGALSHPQGRYGYKKIAAMLQRSGW